MKLARLLVGGQPVWSIIDGENAYVAEGDIFGDPSKGAPIENADGCQRLAPLDPVRNKVVALLGNWGDKAGRDGPGFFIKPSSSLINSGDTVIYPQIATQVNLEPELGVVIGRQAARVSVKEAETHVLGYTIVNDVTAFGTTKEVNFAPLFGKAFDTFGVIGPHIVPGLDPTDQTIRAAVNDEEFLVVSTGLMLWNAFEVVSWVSQVMTLNPGDVIALGAPPGFNARDVNPGDRMTVTIDAIGRIDNPVRPRA